MKAIAKVIVGAVIGQVAGAIIGYIFGVAIFEHSFIFPPPGELIPYILPSILGAVFGGLITGRNLSTTTHGRSKRAWLAALLNIFPYPLGFGYLYLGHPRKFAFAFFAGLVAAPVAYIGFVIGILIDSVLGFVVGAAWPFVVLSVFTAGHAWRLAR